MPREHIPEEPEIPLDEWVRLRNQPEVEERPVYHPRTERRQRVAIAVLAIMLLIVGIGAAVKASAQTAPTMSFKVDTTVTASGIEPKLVWTTSPAAASCTASGDWTGTKPASGELALAAITSPKSYTLKCSWSGDNQAKLAWTPPTKNSDGTSLTDLAGTRVVWGASATTLTQAKDVAAGVSTYTVDGLGAGTWYFAVKAFNTTGVESILSNVTSKVIRAPVEQTHTVEIKQPNAPTQLPVT